MYLGLQTLGLRVTCAMIETVLLSFFTDTPVDSIEVANKQKVKVQGVGTVVLHVNNCQPYWLLFCPSKSGLESNCVSGSHSRTELH